MSAQTMPSCSSPAQARTAPSGATICEPPIHGQASGGPPTVLDETLQLLLCGLLIPPSGTPPLEQLAYLVPARWGFAMVTATTPYGQSAPDGGLDPLWTAEPATWVLELTMTLLLTAAVAFATWLVVRRSTAR